ncbi:MAG: hypothetical protein U1A77_16995 [Pirellulales bacterium]
MSLRLTNLELPVELPEEALREKIAQRLLARPADVSQWKVLRRSLDARSRDSLKYVYSILIDWPDESSFLARHSSLRGVEPFTPEVFVHPPTGAQPLDERPVVVGSGPAGLLAAYYLAERGFFPIILERGEPVKPRVAAIRSFDRGGPLDPENNYLFGEGGAGTFSDGKLTCRMTGADVDWVLERFIECGGKPSIRFEHRPHLGSNRLPLIVRNLRRKIEAMGGEYRFGCRLESLEIADGQIRGVLTSSGRIPTSLVVLAIGHSARDTYEMLHQLHVPLAPKAFQLGLRIEQPQAQVNRHKYGRPEYLDLLGAADYTLTAKGDRDVFTFCMCAGGIVIPSISEAGQFCSNGMSNSRHDSSFANSGVMVTLDPSEFGSDHPLAGVEIQRKYERVAFELGRRNYLAPQQSAHDFLADREPSPTSRLPSSYERGTTPANLNAVLPPSVIRALRVALPRLDRQFRGDFLRDATLVGPEMRGSSPVRIPRLEPSREVPGFAGLYPIGEGAGYAGGIVSAAVDGLRTARTIAARFAPR